MVTQSCAARRHRAAPMAMTPISSSPPTRALPPFPTPPTRSRPRRANWLWRCFSPPAAAQGYDHKKMGIHRTRSVGKPSNAISRELGTDIQTVPFTACGVGDGRPVTSSGNGMLALAGRHGSSRLSITATSSSILHRIPAISHARAPAHVQPAAIELAGLRQVPDLRRAAACFSRSLKTIPLALEVRSLLDFSTTPQAAPFEVMTAILKARVDRALVCGGIGTYIRALGGKRRSGWRPRQ